VCRADLQLDDSHYELKGIRVDSSRTNCSGGVRSTGFSTGVAKKELSTANLMAVKAVQRSWTATPLAWPWARGRGSARRLEEVGGSIKPLAFGQFGEMGPGLEALLASMVKRGADEMADRYLIENREAAVGVQMFHMLRQRWGGAAARGVAGRAQRKRRSLLLGRLKYALPG
jgi:hypothetical protein